MDLNLAPQTSNSAQKSSLISVILVFVVAFVFILLALNAPVLIKSLVYPFTHSEDSNNEQLTQQYRDVYGYEKHPELITAVERDSAAKPVRLPVVSGVVGQVQLSATISIPKINVSAPVIQVPDSSDATILGALKNGVVLYPGSAYPGQTGTSVIVGHSSSDLPWTKYSAVFSLLGKLQADDLIYINVGPAQYVYRVQAVQKGSAQQLINSGLSGDLIVSTCWPIGTDTNRIAISATLLK